MMKKKILSLHQKLQEGPIDKTTVVILIQQLLSAGHQKSETSIPTAEGSLPPETITQTKQLIATLTNGDIKYSPTVEQWGQVISFFEALETKLDMKDESTPNRIQKKLNTVYQGKPYREYPEYVQSLLKYINELIAVSVSGKTDALKEMLGNYPITSNGACPNGEINDIERAMSVVGGPLKRVISATVEQYGAKLDMRGVDRGSEVHVLPALYFLFGVPKSKITDPHAYPQLKKLNSKEAQELLQCVIDDIQHQLNAEITLLYELFSKSELTQFEFEALEETLIYKHMLWLNVKNQRDETKQYNVMDTGVTEKYRPEKDAIQVLERFIKQELGAIELTPEVVTLITKLQSQVLTLEGMEEGDMDERIKVAREISKDKDRLGTKYTSQEMPQIVKGYWGNIQHQLTHPALKIRVEKDLEKIITREFRAVLLDGPDSEVLTHLDCEDNKSRVINVITNKDFLVSLLMRGNDKAVKWVLSQFIKHQLSTLVVVEALNNKETDLKKIVLFELIKDNKYKTVSAILTPEMIAAIGADNIYQLLSTPDPTNYQTTALHFAGHDGFTEIFKVLFNPKVIDALGADKVLKLLLIRDVSYRKFTIFHWVGIYGYVDIFKELLRPEVIRLLTPDAIQDLVLQLDFSDQNRNVLHWAELCGHISIFTTLLSKDVIEALGKERIKTLLLNNESNSNKFNVFHTSAQKGNHKLLKALLNPDVITALGAETVQEILLTPVASDENWNLLHLAIYVDCTEILNVFFDPNVISALGVDRVQAIVLYSNESLKGDNLLLFEGKYKKFNLLKSILDPKVIQILTPEFIQSILLTDDPVNRPHTPICLAQLNDQLDTFNPLFRKEVIEALGKERVKTILLQTLPQTNGETVFHAAAQKPDTQLFKALLNPEVIVALGPGIVQEILLTPDSSHQKCNVFHCAGQTGHAEVLDALLTPDVIAALGVDRVVTMVLHPDADNYKYNLLHWAGLNGKYKIFRAILNPKVIEALTPEIIQDILLTLDSSPYQATALFWAAFNNKANVFKEILSKKTINALGPKKIAELLLHMTDIGEINTPLLLAAEKGYTDIFRALLNPEVIKELGPSTVLEILLSPSSTKSQFTPLHLAGRNGFFDIFEVLLAEEVVTALGKENVITLLDEQDKTGVIWGGQTCIQYLSKFQDEKIKRVIDKVNMLKGHSG
jgi:ankyrin repeat protein